MNILKQNAQSLARYEANMNASFNMRIIVEDKICEVWEGAGIVDVDNAQLSAPVLDKV